MSENKCDPILNISIPDLSSEQIQNLIELGKNRPLTIQDILTTVAAQDDSQVPSRNSSSPSNTFSSPTQSNSRSNNGAGNTGAGGSSSQTKPCTPLKGDRGGWNMPFTSHGKIQGIPIEPRELNCDCIGN